MTRRTILTMLPTAAAAQEIYKFGADSQRQPGVPKGTVTKLQFKSPKIFPGTARDYWVYVPAQYKADKPTCGMVFQDGGGYIADDGGIRGPLVLDNLIHKGDMPVTIGIFVNPGIVPALLPDQQNRYNRSFEYDAMSDRYARFLIDELIPEVAKNYNLSKNPDDWGLCGQSSGGICAFNAAWHRPDHFRRVVTFVGSFSNLRGGNNYPTIVRKMEPKPLRVFLQDGSKDANNFAGSWWMGNQDLYSALEFMGYDAKFVTGSEAHNMKHGGPILPDALRWSWRDYGKPLLPSRATHDGFLFPAIVDMDKGWEQVSANHKFTEGPAVAPNGDVFFTDVPSNKIHKIEHATGKSSLFRDDCPAVNGTMFGPDGRLYACLNGRKQIVSYGMNGDEKVIAEGYNSNDLCITAKGDIYFTEPPTKKVWHIPPGGQPKAVITEGIEFPNGVLTSPDYSLLLVADARNRWVWSYQIQPDGSLAHGQAFYHLEIWDDNSISGADGMTVDSDGFLYVATRLGLQVCDQPGRVNLILAKPHPGPLSNVVFGGPNLDTLYVTAGDRVFRRPAKRHGVLPWKAAKPPQPRL